MSRLALLLLLLDASPRTGPERVVVVLDRAKGIRMEFVRIAPGRFSMGGPDSGRVVRLTREFWLQTTEVTQAQYQALMGVNPSQYSGPDRPVDSVSWTKAQEFLAKLSSRVKGRVAGLPTEAEWEYACRAGSTATWCFGDDEAGLAEYAWFGDSVREEGSHPVGRKKPNRWGLYDMHGNVLEWVADWEGRLEDAPQVDPRGPDEGTRRVIRGGGWWGEGRLTASGRRAGYEPDFTGRMNGFRAALRAK